MAYNTPPTKSVGDTFTAAEWNTYIRDNQAAGVPDIFAAKGDLAIASGANAAGALTVGSDGQLLMADASQALGVKWIGGGMHLIEEISLAAPAASVSFATLPTIYRHLHLMVCARTDSAESAALGKLQFNGDAGSNYAYQKTYINNSSLNTFGNGSVAYIPVMQPEGTSDQANSFGFVQADIFYYRNTNFYKNVRAAGGFISTGASSGLNEIHMAAWWKSTSAITTISLLASSYDGATAKNWLANSIFSLYGVI